MLKTRAVIPMSLKNNNLHQLPYTLATVHYHLPSSSLSLSLSPSPITQAVVLHKKNLRLKLVVGGIIAAVVVAILIVIIVLMAVFIPRSQGN